MKKYLAHYTLVTSCSKGVHQLWQSAGLSKWFSSYSSYFYIADIQPSMEVLEYCTAFLLNIRDWDYLSNMENTANGYIEVWDMHFFLSKSYSFFFTYKVANKRKLAYLPGLHRHMFWTPLQENKQMQWLEKKVKMISLSTPVHSCACCTILAYTWCISALSVC